MVISMSAQALTIKIGSIAPARSPWDKAIKNLGREWASITKGMVKIKIYPGGIVGNEEDMIRKMRMGMLGGAALTNVGMTHIYPDVYVLNYPMLINTEKEFNYIFPKVKETLEKGIEKKGFKVLIWSLTGWINFFTKEKVVTPKDLKKHKISFTTGAPEMEQAWKEAGYHIVPTELKDMMMSLQSGMTDAFYLPPVIAASGQYFALTPHMASIKIAPLVGGIVVSAKVWNRVPEMYKEEMMKAAEKISKDLYGEIMNLENEAVQEMVKRGLKVVEIPQEIIPKWHQSSQNGMSSLVGSTISQEIYDDVLKYLNEYRNHK
jgi:TRAP-type transport system periplasmic protein